MRGSLSPSVLAKNKRNAVFRLVSVTNKTTAQSGEASESVPQVQTYIA